MNRLLHHHQTVKLILQDRDHVLTNPEVRGTAGHSSFPEREVSLSLRRPGVARTFMQGALW